MTNSGIQGVPAIDDVSCLGTTRAKITSAMTTLSDYTDSVDDSSEDPDQGCNQNLPLNLDDSGIVSNDDIDDGNRTNHKEDAFTELEFLKEKIAKLKDDNDKLKAQLRVYEMTGEFPFSS